MKKTCYLIGGLGNNLFQINHDNEAYYSHFFLLRPIRKILNWTQHENILNPNKINIFREIISLFILALDIILTKILKISLFTEFDLRNIKHKPKITTLVIIGYFQSMNIKCVSSIFNLLPLKIKDNQSTLIHVRGGDSLKDELNYGQLSESYYSELLNEQFFVITDDELYAEKIFCKHEQKEIRTFNLTESINSAINAKVFWSGRSTLSFWIVKIRESIGKKSVVQKPFFQSRDFEFTSLTKRKCLKS